MPFSQRLRIYGSGWIMSVTCSACGSSWCRLLANLSHKALRLYRSDKWNPSLSTLVQVDQTLQKHMAAWVKDKNDTHC